jgi:hypothetical protein
MREMRRALVRSALSSLIAAAFAFSALTWGWMPGCVLPGGKAAAEVPGGHQAHQNHSHGDGNLPASGKCAVHLCCIQLAGTSAEVISSARLSAPERDASRVGESKLVLLRPSHSLPFANAPPSPVTPA